MKKIRNSMTALAAICAAAVTLAGCTANAAATTAAGADTGANTVAQKSQTALFDGTFQSVSDGEMMMERREADFTEDVIVTFTDSTLIVDAVNGQPMELADLKEGDAVRAYVDDAMTLSLPPIVNGLVIIGGVPADAGFPSYTSVKSCEKSGDIWVLKTADGEERKIDDSTEIKPYLTRNIVRAEDLEKGREVLIWTDADDPERAEKLVVFAD